MSEQQCGAAPDARVRRKRGCRRGRLAVAAVLLVLAGLGLAAAGPAAGALGPGAGPCDIYAVGGTPCVAAYSTTRALYAAYRGPIYVVRRSSDDATLGIGTLTTGYVDAAAQDRFCARTTCEIIELVDQSPEGNDLGVEGPGANGGLDIGVRAGALPLSIAGQQAYGMDFEPQTGYRDDATHGMATGAAPESMYMVASGTHFNSSCCFDFGNAETTGHDDGNGHMDALYFGSDCWLEPPRCPAGGPWVQADLENGIIASDNGRNQDPAYSGSTSPFVTAMLENNGTNAFVLAAADAQRGPLAAVWDGPLPHNSFDPDPPAFVVPYPGGSDQTQVVNPLLSGYAPMRKEGAIVLGTGGDDTNHGVGSFFEGAITSGVPSLKIEAAVQANIVDAGYASTLRAPVPDVPQLAVRTQARQAVASVLCAVTCRADVTLTVARQQTGGEAVQPTGSGGAPPTGGGGAQPTGSRTAQPTGGAAAQPTAGRTAQPTGGVLAPVRVHSRVHTVSGAAVVRLALPSRVVARARRLGLTRLTATVTVRAATARPGTPPAERTVHLTIALANPRPDLNANVVVAGRSRVVRGPRWQG